MARKLDFGEGWPDYLFLYSGRVLFLEFKQLGRYPTPLQRHVFDILRAQGFQVLVIRSTLDGRTAIEDLIHVNK